MIKSITYPLDLASKYREIHNHP
ncbi:hypothetical protein CBM2586_A10266 [Cupriavidus phytorum]|uniref:Uncharacterized protein n=1 Tax=Cupriavidus taiwanensis TaxID=164546 RepID=A0A975WPC7_9BURK|nr:hypothetical protein CBM2586_A10266 [Cupriavidus taiwanensis]